MTDDHTNEGNGARTDRPAPRCCCNPHADVDPREGVAMADDGGREAKLDVRTLPPQLKHPTIFRVFDELAVGESFTLVNDHDPVPLQRQFERLRPDAFSWEYRERGPEVWRVQIGRRGEDAAAEPALSGSSTVNELVQAVPGALPVLHAFGIDTCCGGDLPLEEAARRHGIDLEEITAAIRPATEPPLPASA